MLKLCGIALYATQLHISGSRSSLISRHITNWVLHFGGAVVYLLFLCLCICLCLCNDAEPVQFTMLPKKLPVDVGVDVHNALTERCAHTLAGSLGSSGLLKGGE